ncbi:MAG: hypothetical protein ACRDNF_00620 [Streptosporangiaceae bacterium]
MTDVTVDGFLDAVEVAFQNAGQIVPWPMHVARIAPYYSDLEAVDLVQRLHRLRVDGTRPGAISALYPSTSSAKSLMLDLIPGLKVAGVPAAARLDFVETVFADLAEAEHGDVFCRNGGHRLLSDADAVEMVNTLRWTGTATAQGRELASAAYALSGAAQSLVWSMHFYGWTDISFVIHGPYQVTGPGGEPAVLIVRDFFDLSPGEVWPGLPAPPCQAIRVCSLHDGTDTFSIDIFNHLLHRHALLESCRWVSLSVDGLGLTEASAVIELRRALVGIVREQKGVIDALDERGVATKFVESRYYAFRRWRELTGDDWRPPTEVYRRLRELPLEVEPTSEPPWPVLREIFDPRLDWEEPVEHVVDA